VNLLAVRGNMPSIDYSRMYINAARKQPPVANKTVMVLGDDLSVYRNNRLGGYFLDWRLSERTLNGVQYYDHVLKIDEMFRTFPPDVILDQRGMFPSLAGRIPTLTTRYKKQGENLYVRN